MSERGGGEDPARFHGALLIIMMIVNRDDYTYKSTCFSKKKYIARQ